MADVYIQILVSVVFLFVYIHIYNENMSNVRMSVKRSVWHLYISDNNKTTEMFERLHKPD